MQTWRTVNWFRFTTIVSLSILTSLVFVMEDGQLQIVEMIRTTLHGLIAGFAFLQCPEAGIRNLPTTKEKNEN